MRSHRWFRGFVLAALVLTAAAGAQAAAIRSTTGNQREAVMEYNGFFLYPVGTEPQGEGDLAPPQVFEIVRPDDQAFTIGRLFTSCTCVALEAEKTEFAQGERAIVRLRNVQLSPPKGMLYAIYVQLRSPIRTMLRFDTFMQSTEFLPSKPGEAPTRGDIVADGVLTETAPAPAATEASSSNAGTMVGEDGVEIIVPKADNYIPDTSEYGLKKQAEAEAATKAEEDNGPITSEVADVEETGAE